MRKSAPKGSRSVPANRKPAGQPRTARTADRPVRRTAAPSAERAPVRSTEPGSAHHEERPVRRPAGSATERPTRRPADRSEDRPARRPTVRSAEVSEARSEDRPARRVLASGTERPARRPPTGPDTRPNRRSINHGTGRPAARPAVKPKPAVPKAPPKTGPRPGGPGQDRLQKILAAAGIASRRACEQIILDGRVQVNGKTIKELGTCADPRKDEITVDFVPIEREAPVYILMNKPKGYVTTVKDDQGRPTVMALIKDVPARLYPVGRLDFNSEGLLLMTNDGALAQVLMGPEHEIPKVYLVKVHRNPRPELLKEFQEGFLLSGRRLKPCHIEIAEKGDNPWLKVTLTEGKNQQIRRMFAAVGHPVSKLRRVQFGPLADPLLKPGTWRFLSPQEIAAIKSL